MTSRSGRGRSQEATAVVAAFLAAEPAFRAELKARINQVVTAESVDEGILQATAEVKAGVLGLFTDTSMVTTPDITTVAWRVIGVQLLMEVISGT